MVSKNNQWQHLQASAQRVPHYGLRKLSVGVASVLLSTTLYMGVSAHADTVTTSSETVTPAAAVPASGSAGTETTGDAAGFSASGLSASLANSNSEATSSQAVPGNSGVTPEKPAGSAADAKAGSETPANNEATNPSSTADRSANLTETPTSTVASDATLKTTLNTTFKWTIHYNDETGNQLRPDSVITHDYTRTDIGDQMGNWSYVPDSVKVTGTPNTGWHIDSPDFKFDQTAGGTSFDYATWQAAAAAVDGYTPKYGSVALTDQLPKNPESLHGTSTVDGGPHEFTFEYVKQPTKVTINYVDDEQGETIVSTGTVSGQSGTAVTITPSLPKGYMLTPDKDVPSTYTVTDADHQVVTIHVQKQFVDLSDTDPQAKQTRTITLHYVYGAGDKQGQAAFDDAVLDVYYHRTATLDRATNQTTYGDWTWDQSQGDPSTPGYHVLSGKWTDLPQSWATVTADVPSIKGYYADLGQNDPTNTNHVPSNTWVFPTYNNAGGAGHTVDGHGATAYLDGYGYEVGPTHTIKYMPNQTTVTVNYVDDDNNGANVGHQSWNGTTGQHIDLTLTPPENYVLTPGWVNPSSYDFDGVNSSWFTVHVKHATQDVTDQQPKDQVTKVTRLTRNHLYGDGPHKGEQFAEPDIFDVAWKRTATKDLVTDKVTFGNWQVNWDDSKSVQGRLSARPSSLGVDGDLYSGKNGYSYKGDNAHSEFVQADGSIKVNVWNKYGWRGTEMSSYPVLNYYYGPGQVNIPVYYIDADTGQKVAEKINGEALTGDDFRDGNTVTIDQSKLTILPTTLTGYQLLPGQTLQTSYKIDTFAGVKGIKVQVAKDRSIKVGFVDDDAGAIVGTPITITGHTGGDPVALDLTVPDKYQLADGQQLPTSYTFTKGSGDLTIHLKHQVVQREATTNVYIFEAPYVDLGARYLISIFPKDQWKVIGKDDYGRPEDFNALKKKLGTISGHVNYDLVTNQVISVVDDWTSLSLQDQTFSVPTGNAVINGIMTGNDDVNGETILEWMKKYQQESFADYLKYSFKAYLSQQLTKVLATEDGRVFNHNGELVPELVPGELDRFANERGDTTGSAFKLTEPINRSYLKNHGGGSNDFRDQNGQLVSDSLLPVAYVYVPYIEKVVTRTIDVMKPDGTKQQVIQKATLDKAVSLSTPDKQNWSTGEWVSYNVPTIPGYTASQPNVAQQMVTGATEDQTVNITYTANSQTTTVVYQTEDSTPVHTTTVDGKTGQTVKVPNEVPTGWQVVDGKVPSEITFGADGAPKTVVTIAHSHVTVTPDAPKTTGDKLPDNPDKAYPAGVGETDLNKTVTRTIKVTTPDGQTKTTAQTAKLTRTADVDEVTGEVKHSDWSTAQWDAYKVPTVDGYTPSRDTVDATKVDANTLDQSVMITYKQIAHPIVETATKTLTEHFIYGEGDRQGKVAAPDSQIKLFFKRTNQVTADGTVVSYGQWELDPSQGTNGYQILSGQWQIPTPGNYDLLRAVAELPDGKKLLVKENQEYHYSSSLAWLNPELSAVDYFDDPDFYDVRAEHTTYVYPVLVYITLHDQDPLRKGDDSYVGSIPLTGYVDESRDFSWDDIVAAGERDDWDLTNYELVPGQSQTVAVNFERQSLLDEIPVNVRHKHRQVQTNDRLKVVLIPTLFRNDQFDGFRLGPNAEVDQTAVSSLVESLSSYQQVNVDIPVTLTVDQVTKQIIASQATLSKLDLEGLQLCYDEQTLSGHEYGFVRMSEGQDLVGPDWHQVLLDKLDSTERNQLMKLLNITDKQALNQALSDATLKNAYFMIPNDFDHDSHVKDIYTPVKSTIAQDHIPFDTANLTLGLHEIYDEKTPLSTTLISRQVLYLHFPRLVTRTINMHLPNGKLETVRQIVDTGKSVNLNKNYDFVLIDTDRNTQQWVNYEVPAQAGYTPSQSTVVEQAVDDQTTDQTVDIYYTPNQHQISVEYVDNDDYGKVVKTDQVPGKTDQTIAITPSAPANYDLVDDSNHTYFVTSGDGQTVQIHVKHHQVTTSESKIVTRTINVHTPHDGVKVVKQTAELTRDVTTDQVTGEKTYGDWTTGEWASYNVLAVAGYVPSIEQGTQQVVNGTTTDQTIDVTYSSGEHTTHINYVDGDGNTVHTITIMGQTDGTVQVPNETPAGWTVVGEPVPTEIAFGPDGHADVTVTVDHQHVTVTPDQPKTPTDKLPDNPGKIYPSGVGHDDLNKTIMRTIKITMQDGQTKVVAQTAKLTRTADVDEVTGEVTYGDWTTGEWVAYDAPSVAGYVPSQTKVDKESVTAASKDTTIVITYSPMQHQISVEYVDDDDHGKVVKTDQVPGKTDQTITVMPTAPANYGLVDSNNRTYNVTSADGQTVQIHVKHHQVTTSESKTVTRTINVHTPHDGVKTVKQTVTLNRDVTTDQVTGDKTYGDWTTGQWKAYTPKAISGYTPSTNEVPNINVDGSSSDQTVDVTYTADAQKVEIVYVDDAKSGAVVKTDQVSGKTDETVKVTPDVPAGYNVVGGVPGSYTMTANGHQMITVHLAHQTKTTSEDKIVTRTINVHTPHDGVKTIRQTAKLTRNVITDQVTGEKTYDDWSTTSWDHYAVPAVAGYVPSIKQVAQQVVNGTTMDQTIDVTYSSVEHTTHINYVDGDGNIVHTTTIKGQTDGTAQVPNETPAGWTVVGESVPTELVFGPDGHADVTVTISHKHVTVTPDQPKTSSDKLPDNPAKTYPNGVGHDDLNKTITRTIKVTTPDGQMKTTEQKAKLTRDADVDEVTGEVTYGDWTTGEWANYKVSTVPGYTPSQSEVPTTKVTDDTKDQTVTVTYTANDQTTHINYVDGDGKVVHTTTVTGKTDQMVKVPNEVPTGWTITDGQVPAEITFGSDGHDDVTVTVDHQHVTVTSDKPQADGTKLPDNPNQTFHGVAETDLNKSVTRTIKITTPAGKTDTITQTAKLTRTADVDEVTGEVTYGAWSTSKWDAYQVPALRGYTASQTVVATTPVTGETPSQTVKITYSADRGTVDITYVDEAGQPVHTTTVTGTTGETVMVPKEVPAGWLITQGEVPTTVTMTGDKTQTITVTVQHRTVTVEPTQPQPDGTPLPDNPGQHFTGVETGDLNKSITRTIVLKVPGRDAQTVTQTVTLTRTATVDEVTGAVTYGDWTTAEWPAVTVPTVDGYTASLAQVPAVTVGSTTDNQTVTVDYQAVEVLTPAARPTATTSATTPEAHAIVTSRASNPKPMATSAAQPTAAAAKETELPQTGDDKVASVSIASLGLLLSTLSAYVLGRKRKGKGHKA